MDLIKKTLLLTSILLLSSPSVFTQNISDEVDPNKEANKNAIYFEFMGNNGAYSFNYERVLYSNINLSRNFALSAGLNLPFSIFQTKIPIELKYIAGAKHSLEIGSGITLGTANWGDESETEKFLGSYFVLRAGYRYSYNGLLIRVAPMLHIPKYWSSAIWGGISIGYSF